MIEPREVAKFRANYDVPIKHGSDIHIIFPVTTLRFVIAALLHVRSTVEYKSSPKRLEALEQVIEELSADYSRRMERQ